MGPVYVWSFQDVTDVRRLERDARLQQRLAAVGEMAAGIAHEIRNPLASMSGSIQVLRQELPLSDDQAQLMDIVLRESERLNDTIRSFLAYARPQRSAMARLDVRRVAAGRRAPAAQQRRSAATHHIIDVDVPAEPVWYEADENQIRQIVWNLATNGVARDGERRASAHDRRRRNGAGGDEWVVLAVQDEGCGIAPEESTESFSRFAARSSEGPALGWPSCTASSLTTTGRSMWRLKLAWGRS